MVGSGGVSRSGDPPHHCGVRLLRADFEIELAQALVELSGRPALPIPNREGRLGKRSRAVRVAVAQLDAQFRIAVSVVPAQNRRRRTMPPPKR